MILQTSLLKILVTLTLVGQPPIVELIHTEHTNTNGGAVCEKAAKALLTHMRVPKGAKVTAWCVPALTRGA